MKTPTLRRLICVTSILVLTGAAALSAQRHRDAGLYINAKWGSTDVEADLGDSLQQVIDGDDETTAVELGYSFGQFFAIQAGFHDLGEIDAFSSACDPAPEVCLALVVPTTASTEAYSLSLVGKLPLTGRITAFAKAGLVSWETDVSVALTDIEENVGSFDDEDTILGIGLRIDLIGSLGVIAEWEQIAGDFETISFGGSFRF